jgi:hypothetical protein
MHVSSAHFARLNERDKKAVRNQMVGYSPTVERYGARLRPLKVLWDEQLHRFVVVNI